MDFGNIEIFEEYSLYSGNSRPAKNLLLSISIYSHIRGEWVLGNNQSLPCASFWSRKYQHILSLPCIEYRHAFPRKTIPISVPGLSSTQSQVFEISSSMCITSDLNKLPVPQNMQWTIMMEWPYYKLLYEKDLNGNCQKSVVSIKYHVQLTGQEEKRVLDWQMSKFLGQAISWFALWKNLFVLCSL